MATKQKPKQGKPKPQGKKPAAKSPQKKKAAKAAKQSKPAPKKKAAPPPKPKAQKKAPAPKVASKPQPKSSPKPSPKPATRPSPAPKAAAKPPAPTPQPSPSPIQPSRAPLNALLRSIPTPSAGLLIENTTRYLSVQDLVELHRAVATEFGGNQAHPGVVDSQFGLLNAVQRPQVLMLGREAYTTFPDKVAAFLFALLINSPFRGGNR